MKNLQEITTEVSKEFDDMIVSMGFDECDTQERRKRHLAFITTLISRTAHLVAKRAIKACTDDCATSNGECNCDALKEAMGEYLKEDV